MKIRYTDGTKPDDFSPFSGQYDGCIFFNGLSQYALEHLRPASNEWLDAQNNQGKSPVATPYHFEKLIPDNIKQAALKQNRNLLWYFLSDIPCLTQGTKHWNKLEFIEVDTGIWGIRFLDY